MKPPVSEQKHAPGAVTASPLWIPGVILSIVSIAVVFWLAAMRVPHPFELEWMEGGSLHHLARIVAGQALYPAPSIDFVPFPYPPFYYWLASYLTPIFGVSFASLRVVSFASTLGVFLVIAAFVRNEGGDRSLALISAGFFAATFRASGAYMDVARIDSLFVLLLLSCVYLLRVRRDAIGLVAAGLLAFLATWTKQTAPVALAPLLLWCAYEDHAKHALSLLRWRRTPIFAASFLLPLILATLLTNTGESSHFLFYVLGAQSGHAIRYDKIPGFFTSDLLFVMPIPILVLVLNAVMNRGAWSRSSALFYATFAAGVAAACLVPRIKVGGALNNLIPIHACLAVLGGVGLVKLLAMPRRAGWLVPALAGAVVVQFLVCLYDPRIALPADSDVEKGDRLVARLRALSGEVLIPAQGYLAWMAGKKQHAHQMPVDDLSRSGLAEDEALRESFASAIASRRFDFIIDSTSRFLRSYPDDRVLAENYLLMGPVFGDSRGLVPRSGWQVGPGEVWVPRPR